MPTSFSRHVRTTRVSTPVKRCSPLPPPSLTPHPVRRSTQILYSVCVISYGKIAAGCGVSVALNIVCGVYEPSRD
ncbi:hypothetical protein BDV12DRAFT_165667 [Aspergillus spectabilis]